MQEKWKKIPDFERYEVSNLGRIKNTVTGKIMSPKSSYKDQYLVVNLYNNKNNKLRTIHRIVAENFVEKADGKNIVNHKNCIRHDNRAANLEWVTNKENRHHSLARILAARKIIKYRDKNGLSQLALADKLGVSARTVQRWEARHTLPPQSVIKLLVD